jgi:hypothetical protein
LEPDIRYFSRRACEEMTAASRAITPAARDRRLFLVGVYLDHLRALKAPLPFDDDRIELALGTMPGSKPPRSAFAWQMPAS